MLLICIKVYQRLFELWKIISDSLNLMNAHLPHFRKCSRLYHWIKSLLWPFMSKNPQHIYIKYRSDNVEVLSYLKHWSLSHMVVTCAVPFSHINYLYSQISICNFISTTLTNTSLTKLSMLLTCVCRSIIMPCLVMQ